jgi:hypothetical protein
VAARCCGSIEGKSPERQYITGKIATLQCYVNWQTKHAGVRESFELNASFCLVGLARFVCIMQAFLKSTGHHAPFMFIVT